MTTDTLLTFGVTWLVLYVCAVLWAFVMHRFWPYRFPSLRWLVLVDIPVSFVGALLQIVVMSYR